MPSKTDYTALSKKTIFLRQVEPFSALERQDLETITQALQPREYPKGQILFQQGDPSNGLYILVQGLVRIYRVTPSGVETSINLFGPGDVLGEFATIDHRPRSATAQTVTACSLLHMSPDAFWNWVREIPELATGMMRLLVSKIRWTAAYAEAVAQYDAAGRLLHVLLLYNERFGQEREKDKSYVLDLGLNQSELASLVGSRREWVNHILQQWEKRGLLEFAAGKITILDLPRVIQERNSRIEGNLGQVDW